MEKQQVGHRKIDNGLKILIERYPALRSRYVKGTRTELEKMNARVYGRFQVMRVINDKAELNYSNQVIKKAFLDSCKGIVPDSVLSDYYLSMN